MTHQANNPLHGITLKTQVEELVAEHGWKYLGEKIRINCFYENPSITSSLKFLRRTPWARTQVEKFYIYTFFNSDGTPKRRQGLSV